MSNDLSACCSREDETSTEESAQALTGRDQQKFLHPVLTVIGTHCSCFPPDCQRSELTTQPGTMAGINLHTEILGSNKFTEKQNTLFVPFRKITVSVRT